MDVIMTIGSLVPEGGGPSRTVPGLCMALKMEGCNVEIITQDLGSGYGKPNVLSTNKVKTTYVKTKIFGKLSMTVSPFFYKEILKRGKNKKPLIIHDNGIWMMNNHFSVSAAKKLNVPLIVTPRGMLEPWCMSYKSKKKKIAWHLYQKKDLDSVDVFHATSIYEVENIRSYGFKQPVALIPNGITLSDNISRYNKEEEEINVKTALFLSRIHPKKGLLNLIKAWGKLKPKYWRLIIAGPDEKGYQRIIEEAAKREGVIDQIQFTGMVGEEEKWKLYRNSDLFVLPTFSENFGIVIAEALFAGVPVITTRETPWEELQNQKCGWWIEIGEIPLAKALEEAIHLKDKKLWEMGQRGREYAKENFSWKKIAEKMKSVYIWTLNGGKIPDCIIMN